MAERVLITGGGCEEPLDGVRYLANTSTGRTASDLAESFASSGWEVCLLAGSKAVVPAASGMIICRFRTHADLMALMKTKLGDTAWDLVVQAAAVSDFGIAGIEADNEKFIPGDKGKIESSDEVRIILRKHQKLINRICEWSLNKEVSLVGFKLTNGQTREQALQQVDKLFQASSADWVVWNDLTGLSDNRHPAEVFDRTLRSCGVVEQHQGLAELLLRCYREKKQKMRRNNT